MQLMNLAVFYFLDQSIVLNGENVHQSVLKSKMTSSNVSTQRYSVYTQEGKTPENIPS